MRSGSISGDGWLLGPGNVADIGIALPLLQAVVPPKRLIADRAYDAQSLRDWLKSCKVIATIPSTATRTAPYEHSWIAYPRRNRIERLFGHLKTGDVSRPAMTACPATIWLPSRSSPVSLPGPA
ncbi:hypothetical protein GCM10007887_34070 [Methylobacterium haplocladii]|uniref:Transposase IS4-like domain-containing protein n=1 Tax=Methylobacterium haplocladii TaxID=1176176 RepID=A0A512IW33_9HYPH|nr:hypothetical protein MHA02_41960 [Methylobacterium haplocladii]GJD86199.1 hypothetical protein HPGCJGGD_4098 [Methylobacterium haplocladii]GLS60722.1 hypothetical protein GCM10007887_34070 [Methylobacterium haplocladii]